jgi:hypothetical protein
MLVACAEWGRGHRIQVHSGNTWMGRITRRSGSLKADRNALKLVRILRYGNVQPERREVPFWSRSMRTGTSPSTPRADLPTEPGNTTAV